MESGRRSKIDQPFLFEETLDFTGYAADSIPEKRYRLIGVVVHQGDAHGGHYFSYVRETATTWICLNDTGVTTVSTPAMKQSSLGELEGSSAYLLFYARFDSDTFALPAGEPDAPLIAEIEADNAQLLTDSVYFSRPFADFMVQFVTINGFTDAVQLYFEKVLLHSVLIDAFRDFRALLLSPVNLSVTQNFFSENCAVITTVMTECTNAKMRVEFATLLRQLFETMGPENDMVLVLMSFFDEGLLLTILSRWRTSFEFFGVFSDFCDIGPAHRDFLVACNLPDRLLDFLTARIPAYVSDKANGVTAERFTRLVDMTSLLRLFISLGSDPSQILTEHTARWVAPSAHHAQALLDLWRRRQPSDIGALARLIERAGAIPSEPIIVALLKADAPAPLHTHLKEWLGEAERQAGVLRGLRAEIARDRLLLPRLARVHEQVFSWLAFSLYEDVRADFTGLLREHHRELAWALQRLLGVVSQLSAVAAREPDLAEHYMRATEFLRMLIGIAPELPDLQQWADTAASAIVAEYKVAVPANEHFYLTAQFTCALYARGGRFGPDMPLLVQIAIAQMPAGHRDRDRTLAAFFATFPARSPFSDSPHEAQWTELVIGVLLTDDGRFPTARPLIVERFRATGQAYATASRFLRALAVHAENIAPIDGRLLAELLALAARQAASLAKDIDAIGAKPGALAKCLAAGRCVRPGEPHFGPLVAFLAHFVRRASPAALPGDGDWLRAFADAIAAEDAAIRASAIEGLVIAMRKCRRAVAAACADRVIAERCPAVEAAPWVAAWIEAADADELMARRCAEEVAAAVARAESAAELQPVFAALNRSANIVEMAEFVDELAKSGCCARLVELGGGNPGVRALERSIHQA